MDNDTFYKSNKVKYDRECLGQYEVFNYGILI